MEFSSSYFQCTFGNNSDFMVGFSGAGTENRPRHSLFAPCRDGDVEMKGSGTRSAGVVAAPRLFYVPEEDIEESHHFLEECFRCSKLLSGDIFMYRGDMPFCSEECRQQQIEMDSTKHRGKKHSSSSSARAASSSSSSRKEHPQVQQKQSSQRIPIWA